MYWAAKECSNQRHPAAAQNAVSTTIIWEKLLYTFFSNSLVGARAQWEKVSDPIASEFYNFNLIHI